MSQTLFTPPAPLPRKIPPGAKTTLPGIVKFFDIMRRNPLEIWTEPHFEKETFEVSFLKKHYVFVYKPELIRHYLVTNAQNYGLNFVRKAMFEPIIGEGLFIAEGARWTSTRKSLTPVFTPRMVSDFSNVMLDSCTQYADELAAKNGETVAIAEEMLALTLDVFVKCMVRGDTAFDKARFSQNVSKLLGIAGMPHPFDLVGAPMWAPRVGRGSAIALVKDIRAQVRDLILRQKAASKDKADTKDVDRHDFVSLLLSVRDENGEPLDTEALIDNLLTFLLAGHETTARSLAWTLFILSQTPDVYERVIEEIESAPLSSTPPSQWAGVMPYLEAVLKESMRLYPAAPQMNRLAKGPDTIGDLEIKPGTEVLTSIWALHRHKLLWENPDQFQPERFYGAAGKSISKFAFLPFGAGPRVCIGASFSMQEMMIALALILQRVRLSHVGRVDPMPVMKVTLHPSTPIYMRVDKR